jgi:hypothetical protein
MSWPMLLIEKHYPWQYPPGTKKRKGRHAAAPPISVMNSRLLIQAPGLRTSLGYQGITTSDSGYPYWGMNVFPDGPTPVI